MTATINLTNGGVVVVDADDLPMLSAFKWRRKDNKRCQYAVCGTNTLMHRLILALSDSSLHVDHINGNGLDNRRSNIRVVSHADNMRNKNHGHGSSRFVGVHRKRSKWAATIKRNGRTRHIGVFHTEEAAAAAYLAAREQIDGRAVTDAGSL